jgi:hypothetical protein
MVDLQQLLQAAAASAAIMLQLCGGAAARQPGKAGRADGQVLLPLLPGMQLLQPVL